MRTSAVLFEMTQFCSRFQALQQLMEMGPVLGSKVAQEIQEFPLGPEIPNWTGNVVFSQLLVGSFLMRTFTTLSKMMQFFPAFHAFRKWNW